MLHDKTYLEGRETLRVLVVDHGRQHIAIGACVLPDLDQYLFCFQVYSHAVDSLSDSGGPRALWEAANPWLVHPKNARRKTS